MRNLRLCSRIHTGFNGAAISRSRNLSDVAQSYIPATGFNGAAISRSRNLETRLDEGDTRMTLQWGRDLSIAESAATAGTNPTLDVLQWGRDLSIAESQ